MVPKVPRVPEGRGRHCPCGAISRSNYAEPPQFTLRCNKVPQATTLARRPTASGFLWPTKRIRFTGNKVGLGEIAFGSWDLDSLPEQRPPLNWYAGLTGSA